MNHSAFATGFTTGSFQHRASVAVLPRLHLIGVAVSRAGLADSCQSGTKSKVRSSFADLSGAPRNCVHQSRNRRITWCHAPAAGPSAAPCRNRAGGSRAHADFRIRPSVDMEATGAHPEL